jgi:hypothetical protein
MVSKTVLISMNMPEMNRGHKRENGEFLAERANGADELPRRRKLRQ